jgi:hypothetical protein
MGDPLVLGSLAGGALLLLAWYSQERRAQAPLLPLELFRAPAFSGANLFTLFLYAAMGGTLFFFPMNLVQVRGYSATQAGLALLPLIMILSLLSRWVGGMMERTGARTLLVSGSIVAALGYILFSVPGIAGSYWTTYFPSTLVLGIGMSLCVAPLTTVVMAAAPRDRAGIASGINNAISRVASLLAIAILGALFVWRFRHALHARFDALQLAPGVRHSLEAETGSLAAMKVPESAGPELAAALGHGIKLSFMNGFRLVSWASAGLALASAVVAGLTIEKKGLRT